MTTGALTLLLVVVWFYSHPPIAQVVIVPIGADCATLGEAYLAQEVTGKPDVRGAKWSCQDVDGEPESGG